MGQDKMVSRGERGYLKVLGEIDRLRQGIPQFCIWRWAQSKSSGKASGTLAQLFGHVLTGHTGGKQLARMTS
jgi:hypothetical protein